MYTRGRNSYLFSLSVWCDFWFVLQFQRFRCILMCAYFPSFTIKYKNRAERTAASGVFRHLLINLSLTRYICLLRKSLARIKAGAFQLRNRKVSAALTSNSFSSFEETSYLTFKRTQSSHQCPHLKTPWTLLRDGVGSALQVIDILQ